MNKHPPPPNYRTITSYVSAQVRINTNKTIIELEIGHISVDQVSSNFIEHGHKITMDFFPIKNT